jgi:hypothetical protein
MPLGDSITQADTEHDSYRYLLWKKLTDGGYNVDFVGSMDLNHRGGKPLNDFDHDHEGHWGWRADQFITGVHGKGSLSDFMENYTPDIVLIHLGSNDILWGESTGEIREDLKHIINIIKRTNPDVAILIAQLIPVTDEEINSRINMLNEAILKLPAELHLESQLVIINLNEGFNPYEDTYDGIHPNSRGEEKMAAAWYDELENILSRFPR